MFSRNAVSENVDITESVVLIKIHFQGLLNCHRTPLNTFFHPKKKDSLGFYVKFKHYYLSFLMSMLPC